MTSALKKLHAERPSLEDLTNAMNSIATADPRVAAILASTYLEDVTEIAVGTKFIELSNDDVAGLFQGSSPLSSFSAKVKLAYALGLIGPKARHDLDRVREIRNVFAHAKISYSFDTDAVANTINGLHFKALVTDWNKSSNQMKFSLVVRVLQIYLIGCWVADTTAIRAIREFDPPKQMTKIPVLT